MVLIWILSLIAFGSGAWIFVAFFKLRQRVRQTQAVKKADVRKVTLHTIGASVIGSIAIWLSAAVVSTSSPLQNYNDYGAGLLLSFLLCNGFFISISMLVLFVSVRDLKMRYDNYE